MKLRTTTGNLEALKATNDAMSAVEAYMEGRRSFDIESADQSIDRALKSDRDYCVAVFYRGVIYDLRGTPADAVPYFERILSESDDANILLQAKYSLGVAYYHRYSHRWLEKASHYLGEVIQSKETDSNMRSEATAVLSQVHAMWIRPGSKDDPNSESFHVHMKKHFDLCNTLASSLQPWTTQPSHVAAPAANAIGMANMYVTDYLYTDCERRKHHLEVAEKHLTISQKLLPRDWANTCDIGSLWLRKGMLAKNCPNHTNLSQEECFEKAKMALTRVVEELRLDYGFALHELGRLHRYWEKFDEAVKYQDRALAIQESYRDIRDTGVQREREWSRQHKADYPEPVGDPIAGGA